MPKYRTEFKVKVVKEYLKSSISYKYLSEKYYIPDKENPNYGYRRITAMLKRLGLKINKKKVHRLVQNLKLQVKSFSRKSRKYSSYKGQVGKIAGNKIKRNFKVEKPYTQITTDTVRVCEKFCVSAPPDRLWADIFYFFKIYFYY